ncbi:MAG: chemotaxis protein CheC [Nanobdellota archaeon]
MIAVDDALNLSEPQLDALREMGNIGTGNAITALSKFINKNIDMNIPESKFVDVTRFTEEFGGPEKIVTSIYLEIKGELTGDAMFVFSKEGAFELIDIMMGRESGTTTEFTEMSQSAFTELSNILTGAFLSALSNMLDVQTLPSVPHTATDMAQSLLDFILAKISNYAQQLFCVKTKINVEGHHINGDFFVVFDKPSLEKMLEILQSKFGM